MPSLISNNTQYSHLPPERAQKARSLWQKAKKLVTQITEKKDDIPLNSQYWLEKLDSEHRPWSEQLTVTPAITLTSSDSNSKSRTVTLVPAQTFKDFVKNWQESTVTSFFDFIKSHFPSTHTKKITYLETDKEKAPFLVTIENGVFSNQGNPLSTQKGTHKVKTLEEYIFVFSSDQNLYIAPFTYGEFHHSSILAGKPIFFAGEITIRDGKLVAISNRTGHYRPSTYEEYLQFQEHLVTFLKHLQTQGVDLNGVNLSLLDLQGKTEYSGDAAAFLQKVAPSEVAFPATPYDLDFEQGKAILTYENKTVETIAEHFFVFSHNSKLQISPTKRGYFREGQFHQSPSPSGKSPTYFGGEITIKNSQISLISNKTTRCMPHTTWDLIKFDEQCFDMLSYLQDQGVDLKSIMLDFHYDDGGEIFNGYANEYHAQLKRRQDTLVQQSAYQPKEQLDEGNYLIN